MPSGDHKRWGDGRESELMDGDAYTIHKDYTVPIYHDTERNLAIPQYQYYYFDNKGTKNLIAVDGKDTFKDESKSIVMREVDEGCAPNVMYNQDGAYRLAKCKRKKYTAPNGEEVYATPCIETKEVTPVVICKDICDLFHDFNNNISYVQTCKKYRFNTQDDYTVLEPCVPNRALNPFPHRTVAAEPEVADGQVYNREQTEINVDGGWKVINGPQRVGWHGNPLEVEETGAFFHEEEVSYPLVNKFYTHNGEKKQVVQGEVDRSKAYRHTKKVKGYVHDDPNLKSIIIEEKVLKTIFRYEFDGGTHRFSQGAFSGDSYANEWKLVTKEYVGRVGNEEYYKLKLTGSENYHWKNPTVEYVVEDTHWNIYTNRETGEVVERVKDRIVQRTTPAEPIP